MKQQLIISFPVVRLRLFTSFSSCFSFKLEKRSLQDFLERKFERTKTGKKKQSVMSGVLFWLEMFSVSHVYNKDVVCQP